MYIYIYFHVLCENYKDITVHYCCLLNCQYFRHTYLYSNIVYHVTKI